MYFLLALPVLELRKMFVVRPSSLRFSFWRDAKAFNVCRNNVGMFLCRSLYGFGSNPASGIGTEAVTVVPA
jgi:hypothetical protein